MVRGDQVKVSHRRHHLRVPHPGLDREQRNSAASAVGSESVPEHVRVKMPGLGVLLARALDQAFGLADTQRGAELIRHLAVVGSAGIARVFAPNCGATSSG